jgi:site-specific DNA recombinase
VFDSWNLETEIEKCLDMAQTLVNCGSRNFDGKQKLQRLVLPEGILYLKKMDTVRTTRLNSLFDAIELLKRVLAESEKGNLDMDCLLSSSVPRTASPASSPCAVFPSRL